MPTLTPDGTRLTSSDEYDLRNRGKSNKEYTLSHGRTIINKETLNNVFMAGVGLTLLSIQSYTQNTSKLDGVIIMAEQISEIRARVDQLDDKYDKKITELDNKYDVKIDAVRDAIDAVRKDMSEQNNAVRKDISELSAGIKAIESELKHISEEIKNIHENQHNKLNWIWQLIVAITGGAVALIGSVIVNFLNS